jgi:hypothetical protein
MAQSIFAQDGFTITDTIPGVPGLYPPVRLTYRPCSDDEAREFERTPDAKAKAARAALILSHLENQTISAVSVDAAGKETLATAVLTAETFGKLHAGIGAAIANRVLGYVGPAAASEGN